MLQNKPVSTIAITLILSKTTVLESLRNDSYLLAPTVNTIFKFEKLKRLPQLTKLINLSVNDGKSMLKLNSLTELAF